MMSQYFNLEEGGGNSISESFQRGPPPAADIKRISSRREFKKSFYSIVIKLFRVLKKIITCIVQLYYPKGPIGYSVFLVWYMFSMFLDPLYLYIPVINDDKKCFKLDMPLAILAIFYRSTYDFLYVSNFILNMQKDHSHQNFKKKLPIFIVDLFIVLPLPQVTIGFYYS
ncbi:Cyclic nucleotide-gated ion channel 1 [Melia azedarach]|uniref:Cyclic nucleotide-gated ion channel 1 n=1 Tax=Melia azedarach TaxID=155640 RepID=A0ACC1X456_MELAZ|nr:Cyclic nucleotide-gated ion channel 1 [Melia azedarach]